MVISEEEKRLRMQALREQMKARIDRYGYTMIGVFATQDEPDSPTFAYTIGLSGRGWPELIVFGVSGSTGQYVIDSVVKRLKDTGQEPHDRLRLDKLINDYPVELRAIPDDVANNEFLVQAQAVLGRPVTAMQIVLTDKDSPFPWEPGCTMPQQDAILDFSGEYVN